MIIFVFGSNRKGIHGAGTARIAAQRYGAKFGVGEGRTGQAYAIPTKETPYKRLRLSDVREGVERFLSYAQEHPELTFRVVRIGCGLAGFTDDQMASLFDGAPTNCYFDPWWEKYGLKPYELKPWSSE